VHWESDDVGAFVARPAGVDETSVRHGASLLGPLARVATDAAVTDIVVNGGAVWADRGRGMEREESIRLEPGETHELAVRLVALGGRHLDEASPAVDARLPGGVRVHAILAPVAAPAPLLSIRLPAQHALGIDALDAAGAFPPGVRALLEGLVRSRRNLLVTGAAGSGKTTLLAALLALAEATERLVLVEDVAELRVAHEHVVALEARQPNLEGAGAIGLARLVREALRMRPDRIVLGECRGAEIRELLSAMNTGHDGGAGTLHANSLADVPARLEALGALAGLDPSAVARQASSAIGAVIHLGRVHGIRTVVGVGRLQVDHRDRLTVGQVWPPADAAS